MNTPLLRGTGDDGRRGPYNTNSEKMVTQQYSSKGTHSTTRKNRTHLMTLRFTLIVKKHIRRHGKTRAKSEELITCRGRVNACNACNACNARNACNACNAHTHRLCKHLLPKHLLQVQGMSTPTMRSHAQCLFARVCVCACLCFFDCFVYSSSCDDTLGLIPKPTAELVDAEPVCGIFFP